MKRKYLLWGGLLLILLLAFIVRIWPIQLIHWWDETVYLQHAEIFAGLRADLFNEFHLRPPLLSIIFAIGFLVWNSPITASIIASLLGVVGVWYVYRLGKILYDQKTGIIAGLAMGLSPFIVENSRTLMTDVPALSFLTAASYYTVRFIRTRGSTSGFIAGILWSSAILMRFAVLPLFATLFVSYCLFFRTQSSLPTGKKHPKKYLFFG